MQGSGLHSLNVFAKHAIADLWSHVLDYRGMSYAKGIVSLPRHNMTKFFPAQVDANGQSSGSWNTPYSSGTWGSGGSTSTTPNTNNNNNNNDNNNNQQQQQTPASPPPPNGPAPQPAVGDVYYNGNGVLVRL